MVDTSWEVANRLASSVRTEDVVATFTQALDEMGLANCLMVQRLLEYGVVYGCYATAKLLKLSSASLDT